MIKHLKENLLHKITTNRHKNIGGMGIRSGVQWQPEEPGISAEHTYIWRRQQSLKEWFSSWVWGKNFHSLKGSIIHQVPRTKRPPNDIDLNNSNLAANRLFSSSILVFFPCLVFFSFSKISGPFSNGTLEL